MKFNRQNILIALVLSAVIFFNLFLGLPRLSTFSAVDEPYWTYGRISKFWKAVAIQKWSSTDVNDKPGITVAILSGTGLLKYDPMKYKVLRENPKTDSQLEDLRLINFYFRLPIFIFCTLMLLVFYFFLKKLFGKTVALLGYLFIGLSPILFGISLIINPDSLLWIFLPLSLLSYFIFQKENRGSYLLLSGIFFGLSLLTKYVSNILYIFFFFLPFLEYIFAEKKPDLRSHMKESLKNYLILVATSMVTFFVLYPAVWLDPKILLKGTFLSQAFESTWPFFAGLVFLIALDIFLFRNIALSWILDTASKYKKNLIRVFAFLFLAMIAMVLINTYSGMKFFDFQGSLISPKGIGLEDGFFKAYTGTVLADIYSLIFGISPLALLALLIALVFNFKEKFSYDRKKIIVFYLTLFIIFYYLASTVNGVAATVRYQIILYPLAFIICAIGISQFIDLQKINRKALFSVLACFFVAVTGLIGILDAKPFYFAYASELLPKQYLLNFKDMGDGSYEAGNYLNQLPNARSLVVWSDKGAVCESFIGDCFTGYTSKELRKKHFDYFVASAGRKSKSLKISASFKSDLDFENLYDPEKPSDFKLIMGDRPINFVKVSNGNSVYKK